MTSEDITVSWASRFGLASFPLFGRREACPEGCHHVLLDGKFGSFALSVSQEQLWKERVCADWSWSCNLPHHVTVTDDQVAVVRWDKPKAELFTRDSVEHHISTFHSYLAADQVESTQRVIEFMLKIYRSLRSLVANAKLEDDLSIDAFLAFLTLAMRRTQNMQSVPSRTCIDDSDGKDLLGLLPQHGLEALFDEMFDRRYSDLSLYLVPSLAIRHAASDIFQESHFEFTCIPPPDHFGYVGSVQTGLIRRLGTHFTPPTLARTIVEQTLVQIPNLSSRKEIVLLDPVCGSGTFLYEALRAFNRVAYAGRLILAGRDTSKAAIAMAKFVLNNAVADWSPEGGCELQLEVGDSLSSHLPRADIVLMNPPFMSWNALSTEHRARMTDVLGRRLAGQGDYCMAFVSRALDTLKTGGTLATLIPANLLTLKAARKWREAISELAEIRFIASLEDFDLFRFSQFQVSVVVLSKQKQSEHYFDKLTALVSGSEQDSTSSALRSLRRVSRSEFKEVSEHGWHLFETSSSAFCKRPTWGIVLPSTERELERLKHLGFISPVEDLFMVHHGVRTGSNSAFVLTSPNWDSLPSRERVWFRPATINESIQAGTIRSKHYVFYPYDDNNLLINDEKELEVELPVYSARYLWPNKERLSGRSDIVRSGRSDWWGLSRWRGYDLDQNPRILSKSFGGPGSFAVDFDADHVVVQGFSWIPTWNDKEEGMDGDTMPLGLSRREILAAYSVILNSDIVSRILRLYSQHVSGNQYDLNWCLVKHIPLLHLPVLLSSERASEVIVSLSQFGQRNEPLDPLCRDRIERLISELYGSDFINRI